MRLGNLQFQEFTAPLEEKLTLPAWCAVVKFIWDEYSPWHVLLWHADLQLSSIKWEIRNATSISVLPIWFHTLVYLDVIFTRIMQELTMEFCYPMSRTVVKIGSVVFFFVINQGKESVSFLGVPLIIDIHDIWIMKLIYEQKNTFTLEHPDKSNGWMFYKGGKNSKVWLYAFNVLRNWIQWGQSPGQVLL